MRKLWGKVEMSELPQIEEIKTEKERAANSLKSTQ
jgi:hypothetical protein